MKINKILLATRGLRGLVASVLFAALAVPAPIAWGEAAIWRVGSSANGHVEGYSTASGARNAATQACVSAGYASNQCDVDYIAETKSPLPSETCHAYAISTTGDGVFNTIHNRTTSSSSVARSNLNAQCTRDGLTCTSVKSFCQGRDFLSNLNPSPPIYVPPVITPTPKPDYTDVYLAVGAGLLVIPIVGALIFDDDETAQHSISPVMQYSNNDGIWRMEAGVRQEWNTENWLAYHQVTRIENSDNGVFSYNSGMDYFINPFKLSFDSSGKAETIANKMSLAVNKRLGIWEFSPYFVVEHQSDTNGNLVNYAANLETLWRIRKNLTVQPSFAMYGENPRNLGDNAKFNLSAKYRF